MNYDKEPELPDLPPDSPRPRRLLGVLAVLILASAGLLLFWRLEVAPGVPAAPDGRKQVAAEIAFLEGRLEILAANLARLGPDAPFDVQRGLLEEAVARLEQLRRLRTAPSPQDEVRLAEWQVRLGNNQAREWNRQSQELEAASLGLAGRDGPAAIGKLKEALRLQREVNRGLADQSLKNHAREARLGQEAERLEAGPLQAEAHRLREQARAAAAEGRWAAALELYGRARDIQLRLNREYAGTRFSDLPAVDRLAAEMAALNAGEAHDQLEQLVAQAAAAAAAGKPGDADTLFAAAIARQQLINGQFPQSRFVSLERLEQLEADRQTVRAGAAFDEIRALDGSAADHLRRRELFQAQQMLGQAQQKLEAAVAQLPKARGVDEELRARLAYLNMKQADLTGIQDQTYDLLQPLPGTGGRAMLRTEVPQELFTRVMNANPSRNAGDALPVDSVTWGEAAEFCRRLGWVLGAPVHLPVEAEFRAAVGDHVATATHAWGLENGPGKSSPAGAKPANPLGFHDLLGNVAEWLAADAGDTAVLAGGSFTESRGQLQALPLRRVPKTERLRTNGFRVVVEVDLTAAR